MVMALAVLGLMAVLANVQIPYDTIFWVEFQNTGHTPFFGVISLLLLGISRQSLGLRFKSRLFHYLLAFGATALLGLISEYIQISGPRDADVWDFARDLAGAVSFLGLYGWWERSLSKRIRITMAATGTCVLVASVIPLAYWSTAHLFRNASFPIICDFESYWTSRFVSAKDGELQVIENPAGWDSGGKRVAEIKYEPANFSELVVREPYPDWRGYQSLHFDVFSMEDTSVALTVRIEDIAHGGDYSDRFNAALSIHAGLNQVVIPLEDIERAPATRKMAMCSIKAIRVFASGLSNELTLYVDNIRLE